MPKRIFNPFPILQTERLILRQLTIADDQEILTLRSDKAVNKYLDRKASETLTDARNFINKVTANIEKNNSAYWAITLSQTKTFVGTICLFGFSDENDKCEIGYELLPNFQGKGIMKEAVTKVIEYAIQTLKVKSIEAFTHKDNQGSIKLLKKLDFEQAEETNPELLIFTLAATD